MNIRQCLDEECKGLEEQEPLVVFRKQTQACQSRADKQLERLLDHIQGLGLDLQSIPSVAHWQSCEQEHDIPGRSAGVEVFTRAMIALISHISPSNSSFSGICIHVCAALDSQVSSPCGGSHLAQPSSRSVFDVAHSPAMGVLSSGLSASGANAFDETPGKRDTGDRPGALHARLPEPSPVRIHTVAQAKSDTCICMNAVVTATMLSHVLVRHPFHIHLSGTLVGLGGKLLSLNLISERVLNSLGTHAKVIAVEKLLLQCPVKNQLVVCCVQDQTPRVKNWAILQEQNAKLAAILAQHDIKLNTGGFR